MRKNFTVSATVFLLALNLCTLTSVYADDAAPAPVLVPQNVLQRDGQTAASSSDHCENSGTIDGKYTCSGTKTWIDSAKAANMITQTAGSVTTQVMGQNAQTNAQSASTQSAALKGAAETQEVAGEMQIGAGAVNVIMGAMQLQKAANHEKNAKQIKSGATEKLLTEAAKTGDTGRGDGQSAGDGGYISGKQDSVSDKIVNGFALNGTFKITQECGAPTSPNYQQCKANREAAIQSKGRSMQTEVQQIAKKAAGEQAAMADQAQAGGMVSLITGIQQGVSGAFNYAAAQKLKDAANALKDAENTSKSNIQLPGSDPFVQASAPGGQTVIGGSGNNPNPITAPATDTTATKEDGLANLGPPGATSDKPDGIKDAPPAGTFANKDTPAGAGSGGGFGGGGSTSAAGAGPEEPTARAINDKGGLAYDGSGGTPRGGGGGGSGGGGSGGPDLAAMLAGLMKKDEDNLNKNNILDYGGAARAPANDSGSLLDRNADIFKRIHETYQDKNKRGNI